MHLLGGKAAGEECVVPVEATVDGEVVELGEEVQPYDVTDFGAIIRPHCDIYVYCIAKGENAMIVILSLTTALHLRMSRQALCLTYNRQFE